MCPSCRRPLLFMEGTGRLRVGRGWLGSVSLWVSWKGMLVFQREQLCVPRDAEEWWCAPLGATRALPALFVM